MNHSPTYSTLISPQELNELITQDRVQVIDCRFDLQSAHFGSQAYASGHIPRSIFLDLESDLSDHHLPGKTGRHPLPERDVFTLKIKRLGLSPNQQIVFYDQAGGFFASRGWWMMKWVGFNKVAVLDGGFRNWLAQDLPVTREHHAWQPCDWDLSPEPRSTVTAQDIAEHLGEWDLLDARSQERFLGEKEPIDPVAGHIPGAVCADFKKNLDADGKFLPPDKLRARFLGLLRGDAYQAICYCGSGITATHNILAMAHAGLGEAKLYPGSWSEWITDPSRPID